MNIPLSPCVPENLVSRDGFSRPVPRQPAHLHTQAESGILDSFLMSLHGDHAGQYSVFSITVGLYSRPNLTDHRSNTEYIDETPRSMFFQSNTSLTPEGVHALKVYVFVDGFIFFLNTRADVPT